MEEAGQKADLGAYFRDHYLVLNEQAREMWERRLVFLHGEAFDEAMSFFLSSGGVLGLRKDSVLRLLTSAEAGRGGLLLLRDMEAKVLHRVLSWTYVRQGLKATHYEEASVVSLDMPIPTVLAPRITSLFGEKGEVLYPLRDGGHAFLDVCEDGVTLIVEGKPIALGREEAKAFIAKLVGERARRLDLLCLCVVGLFIFACSTYLMDSVGFWAVVWRGIHALLIVLGAHAVLHLFVPKCSIGVRLFYERFFTQRQDEVACYGKWNAPWLSLLLMVVYFALLVGVLLAFVFLPLKK